MKNFVQNGKSIDVVGPTGGVVSGQPFAIGDLALVAATDIAQGATGAASTEGVFDLPVVGQSNAGNVAIAFGDRVYMDGFDVNVDDVNGVSFGIALGVVASGATTTIPVLIGK